MAELLVLLVIATTDKFHWQEISVDTVLKFVLGHTSHEVQRHAIVKLVLDVQRELVVLCVGPVKPLGGPTKDFRATNGQSVTVGISDALLEAWKSKPHDRVHRGVRCGHQWPDTIDNRGAELSYRSSTACAQKVCIGVTKPDSG